jgi:hypothetical protein
MVGGNAETKKRKLMAEERKYGGRKQKRNRRDEGKERHERNKVKGK